MAAKRPVRSNISTKSAKAADSKTSSGVTRNMGAGAIALVAICVLTAAIVMAVRDGSEPVVDVSAADAQAATVATKTAQPNPPAASRTRAPAAVVKTVASETDATAPPDNATPKSSTALSAAVTVSGCLERAGAGFRLKDTSGADAPKSRSWKTGFFKKSSASIQLVDAAKGLRLADHVGRRVSVTGTMIDREMRAHSLQRVQGVCK